MVKKLTLEQRFWSKVNKTECCWLWIPMPSERYGQFRIGPRMERANRVSWKIAFGDIPKGLYVCHTCDNTRCVRPDHLFVGTQTDNMQDMMKKGRGHKARGSDAGPSTLNKDQVFKIRELWSSKKYLSYASLGRVFNVHSNAVRMIILGLTWKHL